MKTIDIKDLCTHCGEDTAPNSGKFVNRIPSGHEWEITLPSGDEITINVNGWMCADCAAYECDECGESIPMDEDVCVYHPTFHFMRLHEECVPDEWKEFIE